MSGTYPWSLPEGGDFDASYHDSQTVSVLQAPSFNVGDGLERLDLSTYGPFSWYEGRDDNDLLNLTTDVPAHDQSWPDTMQTRTSIEELLPISMTAGAASSLFSNLHTSTESLRTSPVDSHQMQTSQLAEVQALPLSAGFKPSTPSEPKAPKKRRVGRAPGPRRPKLIHAKLFACGIDDCGRTFTLEKDLARHQLQSLAHQDFRSETHLCAEERCISFGRAFSRLDNYERHVRVMHGKLAGTDHME
ncbi:hypothetical protein BJ170DRAFT_390680 [Xylariales sp. AK1849]|nr:hypothetical protein BJ170DRAFT_390680 [Xylariales sp. AK1849]